MEDNGMSKCWANIDKNEGSLNSTLNIYFDKNNTESIRSAKISIKSESGDLLDEFTIVQTPSNERMYQNSRMSKFFTKSGCDEETEVGERLEYVVEAGTYISYISQEDADSKALEDIERNGQDWVDFNGKCKTVLWYNREQKIELEKNDCNPDTEKGTSVLFVVDEKKFSSNISQEDADNKAISYINDNAQSYANTNGSCITIKWYNDRIARKYQRSDCPITSVGEYVEFVVEYGEFSSDISKSDANRLAIEYIELKGPEHANKNGRCLTDTWYNDRVSQVFKKQDCGICKEGLDYEYVVDAGKYTYTTEDDISHEEGQRIVNEKALEDIEKYGQEFANTYGTCKDVDGCYVGKSSIEIQRNDCPENYTGSKVLITEKDLPGYPELYVSTTEESAKELVDRGFVENSSYIQTLANNRGECVENERFTGTYSEEFSKYCPDNGVSSKIIVTQDDVVGGPFEAYSQEEANRMAMEAVKSQGPALAEANCTCTWIGEYSEEFTKECDEGYKGSVITVNQDKVEGSPFISNISKNDADEKAKLAVLEKGQDIANELGECSVDGYIGYYDKRFYRNNCAKCTEDLAGILVTSTMCDGYPFISKDENEANRLAMEAVESQGQDIANSQVECTSMDNSAKWEDIVPIVSKCINCVSYKQQIDKNECSETWNSTDHWVEGGDSVCRFIGNAASISIRKNDCENGEYAGTEVEVTIDDLASIPDSGYPFELCGDSKQDEANELASRALQKYAQQIANEKGECQECAYFEKVFYKSNCPACEEDNDGLLVTSNDIGGPYCPDVYGSYEAALSAATNAVMKEGQKYCDINSTSECKPVDTNPVWEDVVPAERECRDGVSMKKQKNVNECSGVFGTDDNYRWVEDLENPCWVAEDTVTKSYTKKCDDGGIGSTITLSKSDMMAYSDEFNNFSSFESQDDANNLLISAYNKYGESIVSSNPEYLCTWYDVYSILMKPECEECYEYNGEYIQVTTEKVFGERVSSTISIDEADKEAKRLIAENNAGQNWVNENYPCSKKESDPVWNETGNNRCNNCYFEKEVVDENACSVSYGTKKWIREDDRDSECGEWTIEGYDCSTGFIIETNTCSGEKRQTESFESEYCERCSENDPLWCEKGCGEDNYVVRSDEYCKGPNIVVDVVNENKCASDYNKVTQKIVTSGSWNPGYTYDCKTGMKYRTSTTGCDSDETDMTNDEYCEHCNDTDTFWCTRGCGVDNWVKTGNYGCEEETGYMLVEEINENVCVKESDENKKRKVYAQCYGISESYDCERSIKISTYDYGEYGECILESKISNYDEFYDNCPDTPDWQDEGEPYCSESGNLVQKQINKNTNMGGETREVIIENGTWSSVTPNCSDGTITKESTAGCSITRAMTSSEKSEHCCDDKTGTYSATCNAIHQYTDNVEVTVEYTNTCCSERDVVVEIVYNTGNGLSSYKVPFVLDRQTTNSTKSTIVNISGLYDEADIVNVVFEGTSVYEITGNCS